MKRLWELIGRAMGTGVYLDESDKRGKAWGVLTAAFMVLGLLAKAGGASWLQVGIFVVVMSGACAALIYRKAWFGSDGKSNGSGRSSGPNDNAGRGPEKEK